MLVFCLTNDKASFQEQRFDYEGISSKHIECSKAKKRQYLGLEAKIDKSKTTLFSQTFKVPENKAPLFFSFLASRPRY